jgi:hypothetical protein
LTHRKSGGPTTDWELKGASMALTDEKGVIILRYLPPGTYSITVTAKGFASFSGIMEINRGENNFSAAL